MITFWEEHSVEDYTVCLVISQKSEQKPGKLQQTKQRRLQPLSLITQWTQGSFFLAWWCFRLKGQQRELPKANQENRQSYQLWRPQFCAKSNIN